MATPARQDKTIRGEVAAREVSAQMTGKEALSENLRRFTPAITKLLEGTGVSPETFAAQVANATRAVPDLLACQPETLIGAALRAAQLGLAPNDARNLCWILPYKGRAQFQLGYGGALELARRALPGLKFDGRPVFPNDEFDVDFGRTPPLMHRPSVARRPRMDRGGDAFAWYVRATFPDGSEQVFVLDREQVEYHRSFSKQPDGMMWTKSYDAAALKSVVMDSRRWLPASAQLVAGIASDEEVIHVENVGRVTYDARGEVLEDEGELAPAEIEAPQGWAAAPEPYDAEAARAEEAAHDAEVAAQGTLGAE